ncbi:MAG: KH domain-containing protein [Bacillota bacterium]
MKELVEILAKALVDKPEEVEVRLTEKEKSIVIELRVAAEDVGKVIGKQGRIARAIRQMVKAAAAQSRKKIVVEIL